MGDSHPRIVVVMDGGRSDLIPASPTGFLVVGVHASSVTLDYFNRNVDSGSQKVQHFCESKRTLRPLHGTTFGVHAYSSVTGHTGYLEVRKNRRFFNLNQP